MIGDLDREADAVVAAGKGVIDDGGGDQGIVGDDAFAAIGGPEHGVTGGNLANLPIVRPDGDHVADADRLVEQEGKARDIVGGDLLQAEAEAHTQCAAKDGQDGDVDADHRQGDEDGDDQQHRAQDLG